MVRNYEIMRDIDPTKLADEDLEILDEIENRIRTKHYGHDSLLENDRYQLATKIKLKSIEVNDLEDVNRDRRNKMKRRRQPLR